MNPTPSPQGRSSGLVVAMGVVTVLAVAFGLYQHTAAQKSNDALAEAGRIQASDKARVAELARRADDAEHARAQLTAQLAEQRTAAEAAKAAPPAAPVARPAPGPNPAGAAARDAARKKAQEDGQAFIAAYETQVRPMLMNIGRAQIERNFADLIRSGKLTPEQIEALETATAEQWIKSIEVTPGSIHPGDPNLKDDELRRVLGEDGFKNFDEARRLRPLQGAVNDIASMSVFVPFTPEQSKQLLQVVANASGAYQRGEKVTPQSIDWNQVINQSQSFLSEPQMTAVKAEAQLPQIMTLIGQFYQAQQPQPAPPANQPPAK